MNKNKLLIFSFAFLSFNSLAAGFNCSKATTNIEKTICSNIQLSKLDEKLNKNYILYKYKYSETAQKMIKEEQLYWVKSLPTLCKEQPKLNDCIRFNYENRIEVFNSYKNKSELIFQVAHNSSEIIYQQFDSLDPFLIQINQEIKKIISHDNGQHEGTTDYLHNISIESISKNLIKINDNTQGINAYPWDVSDYYYFDITQKKPLSVHDFIISDKKNDLINKIGSKINELKLSEPDAKDCLTEIDRKKTKDIISNLKQISINKDIVIFDLMIPHICQAYGSIDFKIKDLNTVLTPHMIELLH